MKKQKLKIAMVASNVIRIPPFPPGVHVPQGWSGAPELIVHFLTEELVKRGHEVTLFAGSDSETSARLESVGPSTYHDNKLKDHVDYEYLLISHAYQIARKGSFDIIHSHFDTRTACFAPLVSTPTISTLHSPLNEGSKIDILRYFKRTQYYASISNNQRQPIPDLNYAVTAYNGIDVDKIPFSDRKSDYLIFVGRINEKKGALKAIEVARRANMPIYLFGSTKNDEYWRKVNSLIDGKRVVYMGIASRDILFEYLVKAKAMLFPISWDEPFGLAAAESLAAGTPVISFSRGSLPEIIEHGKTGYLVQTIDEMVEKIYEVKNLSSADCRKSVLEKFTIEKMVDRYESAYYQILGEK